MKLAAATVSLVLAISTLGGAVAANPTNLITNPSADSSINGAPTAWSRDKWGTNTSVFNYTTDAHSGSHALQIRTSTYKSGDAKWTFKAVPVTGGSRYTFSDWYKSSSKTSVDLVVRSAANKTAYHWLGDLPASSTWKQSNYSFVVPSDAVNVTVYHYLHSVGELTTDDFNLSPISDPAPTPPPSAPLVSISTPLDNAAVQRSIDITANASDGQGAVSVQFAVDGKPIGTTDSTTPFTVSWDSTSVANGSHQLTAIATNSIGLRTTSRPVTVTVNNQTTTPTPPPASAELTSNPSVETATSTGPAQWFSDGWGNNSHSFSYPTSGHTGIHSVKTTISSYTSGDAKWYFAPVAVTGGQTYTYHNWYTSSVPTELDAMVKMQDGSLHYYYLASLPASTDWRQAAAQFTAPAGSTSLTIFQVIFSVGYVQSDDFSLTAYRPAKFNRPVVSLTFDDGWRSIYTNGFPILQRYNFVSTQYLNSEPIMGEWPDYMTYAQVHDFYVHGSELGWHTRTHADLTKLKTTQVQTELSIPLAFVSNSGVPLTAFQNFATPYGAYNDTVVSAVQNTYRSHRSTDVGFNTRDNFTPANIKVQNIVATTTAADVQAWVNQAKADNAWLVIVYHEIGTHEDTTYSTTTDLFDAQLSVIKQSGVTVETVEQALDELSAQL